MKRDVVVLLAIAFVAVSAAAGQPRATGKKPSFIATSSRRTTTADRDLAAAASDVEAFPVPPELLGIDLRRQTRQEAAAKSMGCVECHQGVADMHRRTTVRLGCVDCHGGNPATIDKRKAHVHALYPDAWTSSANPVRSYTLLNHESPQFVRFVNPGDLRIAHLSCGNCHAKEVLQVRKSMMTHGAMLWGSALYNNGSVPNKVPRYGESYSMCGAPQRLQTVPPPSEREIVHKGVVPFLDPLPRFEMTQPGNMLRTFERGGRFRPETGIPERLEENGRPRSRLSLRGLGTENRADPVFVGLAKTRLLDPTLNFLGTNDHPGDFRSSGCTGCHVVYANDRSPVHSGPYAKYGHLGLSASSDPMIPKDEPGHPIDHKFTVGVPTSQCIVCHIHPGTSVMNSYLGFMWWDNETDGRLFYPRREREPSAEEAGEALIANPEESSVRGLWSDSRFLERVSELNTRANATQFADFNGHGWIFRAVFRKNREGRFLDHRGEVIEDVTNELLQQAMVCPTAEERRSGKQRDGVPVHYMDIHLEKGMHCVDCHFRQDVHGDTKLYGEVRAAIEIACVDCHGTINRRSTLRSSGPAAPEWDKPRGLNLRTLKTPFGKYRFEVRGDTLMQNSMVEEGLSWEVVQVADTINPDDQRHYNPMSHLAKTVRFDESGEIVWGDVPAEGERCAHADGAMSCIACHSAWNPSCFGCHLSQKANLKLPSLHFEGDVSKNYVAYNFQTLRDDVYMLARDGNVTGNRIGPARSSCAIHVGSYNQNRESIYVQQQTISGDGLSGVAFSSNVPHTVRGRDGTKQCTDCHLSKDHDNNALLAQLLMQGTNYTNFIGRYCWVGAGEYGLEAIVVTERDEPQAVIGSDLHRLAFPNRHRKHADHAGELEHHHEHKAKAVGDSIAHPFRDDEILGLQARGEYLYAACGPGGLRVFDIAFIDHKGFSERIISAPVSPLGQRFYVSTRHATAVAAPSTPVPDPTRIQHALNGEQPIHPLYGYIYVADREEGLILVGAATLLDGDPTNNYLRRDVTFNPGGLLHGATSLAIVGNYAYVCCDAGLVVVSLDDPKHLYVAHIVGNDVLKRPRAVQAQFRYAFVCDAEGVKVLDITHLDRPVPVAGLPLADARNIYVARTYAYVAAGREGLVILDVKNPEQLCVDQVFNAGGRIHDLNDVKLGITYASEFAYLADGKKGLLVVQLTSADMITSQGFSPRPRPRWIASRGLRHEAEALCVSEGLDRDRAADESGNQIGVFGRLGARPLNFEEQRRFYLRDEQVWQVSDDPDWQGYQYRGPRRAPTLPLPEPGRTPELSFRGQGPKGASQGGKHR
ncbi:MAG TPA: hypothetical protein VMV69_29815 [Pirellulales bacterium]|nr:hypothetical protein [Pirellulales bacterium]